MYRGQIWQLTIDERPIDYLLQSQYWLGTSKGLGVEQYLVQSKIPTQSVPHAESAGPHPSQKMMFARASLAISNEPHNIGTPAIPVTFDRNVLEYNFAIGWLVYSSTF